SEERLRAFAATARELAADLARAGQRGRVTVARREGLAEAASEVRFAQLFPRELRRPGPPRTTGQAAGDAAPAAGVPAAAAAPGRWARLRRPGRRRGRR